MTSSSSLGTHADHHPVRSQPRHRRRRARRADRAVGRAAPAADRDDDAAVLPQGQSGRLPDPVHQPESRRRCRCRRSTNMPSSCWRSRFRSCPASPRCRSTARRNSPCACRSIRSPPPRATFRSTTSATSSPRPIRTRRSERWSGRGRTSTLTRPAPMTKAEEYRNVVVAYRNGAPVKLDEIARVIDSVENDKIASWFNDRALDRARHPAPARRQHRRGGRFGQGPAAGVPRPGPGGDRAGRAQRPLDLDPRSGLRRAGDAAASPSRWSSW